MTIDTKFRHATERGANLFLELGFSSFVRRRTYTSHQRRENLAVRVFWAISCCDQLAKTGTA